MTLSADNTSNNVEDEYFELARQTASEVEIIRRSFKCVNYNTSVFEYAGSEFDYASVYPGSTSEFVCGTISAQEGEFDNTYKKLIAEYSVSGAGLIYSVRQKEWLKVMVQGIMYPM